jgi:DNA-binding CsgD family transcriptional regulator
MSELLDWIGVIEAVYAIDQPKEPWLKGVLRAAAPLMACTGVGALLYDLSNPASPRLDFAAGLNAPSSWMEMSVQGHTDPQAAPVLVHNARKYMCASSSEYLRHYGAHEQTIRENMARIGMAESIFVNGLDASGMGCALQLGFETPFTLSPPLTGFLKRLASHLATGYRLQRTVAKLNHTSPSGEAILDGSGRLVHAEGEAKANDHRESLSTAAEQYRWARGKARREQPAPAVDAWKAMVAARWTLHEQVEADGKRFIHALANEPCAAGPKELSVREQQVAALAALGRSNKLIAYELGLAHATVRVLIARAAKKVGARSRSELIARLQGFQDKPRT